MAKIDETPSIDFFDFLALIDDEYKRLNWSQAKRKDHLLRTYGKKSRYYLTDDQLFELYGYLKAIPKSSIRKIGLRKIGL